MPLLPSQEQWVFETLQLQGLDPREFELRDGFACSDGSLAPALVHRETSYYFAFRQLNNGNWVEFSPGHDKLVDSYGTGIWTSVVVPQFGQWLTYFSRELAAVDLWGAIREESELVAGEVDEADNSPFTADEQLLVAEQLREAKTLLHQSYDLSAEQFAAIDARLDYLEAAAGRLGRIDWRNALVGSLVGLVVQAIVPAAPIQGIFSFLLRAIAGLFLQHPPELPA